MTDKQGDFTETTVSSKTVYRGRLLHVVEDGVLLPDARPGRRECIRHPGAAAMVAFLDRRTVVLVRQFRYAAGRHFLEIPAGKLDRGESPLAAARRELMEECGLAARRWRRLTTIHPCVGDSDERIVLYLATGLRETGVAPDDGEFIQVVPMRLAEALRLVRRGAITDVKTVIGLMWADKFRDL